MTEQVTRIALPPPGAPVVLSSSSDARVAAALDWLSARRDHRRLVVVGATQEAADGLVRRLQARSGASLFGWTRTTLPRLAAQVAARGLAAAKLGPVGALGREAVVTRVIHEMGALGTLGRYAAISERPGLSRALASTFEELRLAGVSPDDPFLWCADLLRLFRSYLEQLERAGLADTARLMEVACGENSHPLLGCPLLLLDVPISSSVERRMVAHLTALSPAWRATAAVGDERSRSALCSLTRAEPVVMQSPAQGALGCVQEHLFSEVSEPRAAVEVGADVRFLSAPGESRECVEIVRLALEAAGRGVPFDQMAVLVRAESQYRAHLAEAFRRAGIPAWFERGARAPDPSGRALLTLLACAAEGLSARRIAEYMSLGELPAPDESGAPPEALEALCVPGEDELLRRPPPAEVTERAPASIANPRRWEQLLVDAAVIGGRDRWERRLDALDADLQARSAGLEDPSDPAVARLELRRTQLAQLRAFVLPIIDALAALPSAALWGEWLEAISTLASRTLRRPERVLSVLSELAPMSAVGPVGLQEVRLVLARRLSDLVVREPGGPAGKVRVMGVEGARGAAFDLVFVPGLAERIFPARVSEDPILLDSSRGPMAVGLAVREDRVAAERLALRLAIGAARQELVLSFPRVDMEAGRPRVPSFYALEVVRAAEGRLPGFEELLRRSERGGAPRVGWPAPDEPERAVDAAEFDLSWLGRVLASSGDAPQGAARYLATVNPHLIRTLRARYMRGARAWTRADGLVKPRAEAVAAMAEHQLASRSFSPTALQKYAACPYQFYLYTLLRLAPREVPEAIEELNALQRGSLVHDAQYDLLTRLEAEGALPLTADGLSGAYETLEGVVDALVAEYRERLAPAIERVWEDGVSLIRSDLREWVRRLAEEPEWSPWRFELAFGRFRGDRRDARSRSESVALRLKAPEGAPVREPLQLSVHGSIDLVERRREGFGGAPVLRATDTKTGRVSVKKEAVIEGGKALQPVIYALALEAMEEGSTVTGGRLSYCTSRGGFEEREVPLDERARRAAGLTAFTIHQALERGFLPAAPRERECQWCDYRSICGAHEEERVRRKSAGELIPLEHLRGQP